MLDGARDTDGHVKCRSYDLAGLTDLQRVVCVTSVNGGA
jgi:hypothetical protein